MLASPALLEIWDHHISKYRDGDWESHVKLTTVSPHVLPHAATSRQQQILITETSIGGRSVADELEVRRLRCLVLGLSVEDNALTLTEHEDNEELLTFGTFLLQQQHDLTISLILRSLSSLSSANTFDFKNILASLLAGDTYIPYLLLTTFDAIVDSTHSVTDFAITSRELIT